MGKRSKDMDLCSGLKPCLATGNACSLTFLTKGFALKLHIFTACVLRRGVDLLLRTAEAPRRPEPSWSPAPHRPHRVWLIRAERVCPHHTIHHARVQTVCFTECPESRRASVYGIRALWRGALAVKTVVSLFELCESQGNVAVAPLVSCSRNLSVDSHLLLVGLRFNRVPRKVGVAAVPRAILLLALPLELALVYLNVPVAFLVAPAVRVRRRARYDAVPMLRSSYDVPFVSPGRRWASSPVDQKQTEC